MIVPDYNYIPMRIVKDLYTKKKKKCTKLLFKNSLNHLFTYIVTRRVVEGP